jgi:hypothetical protein
MRNPYPAAARFLGLVAVLSVSVSTNPLAQTPAPASRTPAAAAKSAVPRTPDGRPDLQGIWDFRTITPMERPKELANKATLTEQEAIEWEIKNRRNQDNRDKGAARTVNGGQSNADVERAYNDFWWDFGTNAVKTRRTSLVIDPPDGRIPELTAEARKRSAERREMRERPAFGPEDRGVGERCILGFNAGPPMLPSAYNNNVQIVQTPGHVVLHNEMVHNARVVPLAGTPAPGNVPQWNGHSRGRWDGDTLVIETKGFKGETSFQNSTDKLLLIERFTRVDADTLLYEFTVNDPTTWTKPWTAQVPMTRSDEQMYEYACHEANYGMENLLKGARYVDREAAGQKSSR